MIKILALLFFLGALSGCATPRFSDAYDLQYLKNSSELSFSKDLPQLPGNGTYLEIPGYIFVAGKMSLHPGKHKISYACPGDWEWKSMTHYVPSIEHEFKVGSSYELYCENGYPLIRTVKAGD